MVLIGFRLMVLYLKKMLKSLITFVVITTVKLEVFIQVQQKELMM